MRERLQAPLFVPEPGGASPLDRLRKPPTAMTVGGLSEALGRVRELRALGTLKASPNWRCASRPSPAHATHGNHPTFPAAQMAALYLLLAMVVAWGPLAPASGQIDRGWRVTASIKVCSRPHETSTVGCRRILKSCPSRRQVSPNRLLLGLDHGIETPALDVVSNGPVATGR